MAPLLVAQKIKKSLSGRLLFEDLTLAIEAGERLAILGANGSGKSTLLRLLASTDSQSADSSEEIDSGCITAQRSLTIACVRQQDLFKSDATVLSTIEESLASGQRDKAARVAKYLGRFGFKDPSIKVNSLSGGWKKRLALACGFAQEADLLLLDEPTNHLDIAAIEWLEEQLSQINSAVVFVSHDRYFIEALASRVVELDRRYPNGSISNTGAYADFLDYRDEFLAQLRKNRDVLNNKVRRETEWLRQGAKARTTKSKHRTAEALKMIDQLKSMQINSRAASVDFNSAGRKTKELLKVESISKTLSGRCLFQDFSSVISPGTCLGVAGDNGSGKSTLLNVLIGKLAPDSGTVVQANNLQIAFFDQARKSLDPNESLEKALMGDAKSIVVNSREYVSSAWARKFLFSVEQLPLPVSRLSGGEQARVLIAKMMRSPADLLVLDEPTNDLDIPTLEVLEESLAEFPGAIILVTHDRFLLDKLSTSIAGLLGAGKIKIFSSYLQWEIAKEESGTGGKLDYTPSSDSHELNYAERAELSKLTEKIEKAEKQVASVQEKMNKIEIASDSKKLAELCLELERAQQKVDQLYDRWSELENSSR